jgi:hypothetical protein
VGIQHRVIGRSGDRVIEKPEHRAIGRSLIENTQNRSSDHPITRSPDHPMVSPMPLLIVLVKPQFEAGREHVQKGGIVRDPAVQAAVIDKVRNCIRDLGARSTDCMESPILGQEGNREFLLYASF